MSDKAFHDAVAAGFMEDTAATLRALADGDDGFFTQDAFEKRLDRSVERIQQRIAMAERRN